MVYRAQQNLLDQRMPRRRILAGVAAVGAVVAVAACSGGSTSGANTGAATAISNVVSATNKEASAVQSVGTQFSVKMLDTYKYDPPTLSIPKGATVTWTNGGTQPHSATDDPSKAAKAADAALPAGVQPWSSGLLDPGKTWPHTFDVVGEYKYYCIPHETLGMLGTITVK